MAARWPSCRASTGSSTRPSAAGPSPPPTGSSPGPPCPARRGRRGARAAPPVEVVDDHDNVAIPAELPGGKAEGVKISLQITLLSGGGEMPAADGEQVERWHRYERSFGTFA